MGSTTSKTDVEECKMDGTLRYGIGQDIGQKQVMEDASYACVITAPYETETNERSPNVRGFFVVLKTRSFNVNISIQVCDGHGGVGAAEFTCQNLLKCFLLEKELDIDCGQAMVRLCFSDLKLEWS